MNEATDSSLQSGLQSAPRDEMDSARQRDWQADRQNELQLGKWLAGAAVGALVMYMLDPQYGAARRAESRQKLRDIGRQTGDAFDKVVRDISSGMGPTIASAGERTGSTVASVAREAGRTLQGIAERETGAAAADAASGAADVSVPGQEGDGMQSRAGGTQENRFARSDRDGRSDGRSAGNGAGSGSHSRSDSRSDYGFASGSRSGYAGDGMASSGMGSYGLAGPRPVSGMRSAALAGGGLLGLFGLLAPRTMVSTIAGLAGIALLARASSRQPLHTMLGAGSHARPVEIERTIRIDASPEQVYDQFADYENFPRFMSNVVHVTDLGQGRSHWIVKGPGGTEFAWTAALTEHDRPHRLAWRSEPGAEVEQTGTISLEPFRSGTRVTVHITYRPPAGKVGKAIARLLGSDPARELEEDLQRMKMLIVRGARPVSTRGAGRASEVLH